MSVQGASSKFFVELPDGEFWNTGYTRAVIEATELPSDKSGVASLRVLGPPSFVKKWRVVKEFCFTECPGPARELDFKSYVQCVHSVKPEIPLPINGKGWKGIKVVS